jgi:hypothetical protein
MQERSGVAI